MSAAPKFANPERIPYGGTQSAPLERPSVRTAPKRRPKVGRFLAGTAAWAVAMLLCFGLVQKNLAIRAANADIAHMKGEINRVEELNLGLEAKIGNAESVAEVERWAKAKGMNPPTGTVQTLQAKPEAVAVRSTPAPAAPAVAEEPQVQKSFWESLVSRVTGPKGQAASPTP